MRGASRKARTATRRVARKKTAVRRRKTRRVRRGGGLISRLFKKKPVAEEPVSLLIATERNDVDRVRDIFTAEPDKCVTSSAECRMSIERAIAAGRDKVLEVFLTQQGVSQEGWLKKLVEGDKDDSAMLRAFLNQPGFDVNRIYNVNKLINPNSTLMSMLIDNRKVNMFAELLKVPTLDINLLVRNQSPLYHILYGNASESERVEFVRMLLNDPRYVLDTKVAEEYAYESSNEDDPIAELIRAKLVALKGYNEAPLAEVKGRPPITILSKKRIHRTIKFEINGQTYFVNTMILPKGTLLFRGTTSDPKENFYGVQNEETGLYHLHSNYNVFFYPYPFSSKTAISGYESDNIYVLTRDIEIVMAVEPSQNSRANRHEKGYLSSCTIDFIDTTHPELESRGYDACFHPDFIKQYPEIVGYIGLAKTDARSQLATNEPYPISQRKYWTFFRDMGVHEKSKVPVLFGVNDGGVAIGIPEIVLYPLNKRSASELVGQLGAELPSLHNYKLLKSYENDFSEKILQKDIDALISPEGLDGMHMTIDLATKLYVLWEEAHDEVKARCVPIEEPNKLKWFNHNLDI